MNPSLLDPAFYFAGNTCLYNFLTKGIGSHTLCVADIGEPLCALSVPSLGQEAASSEVPLGLDKPVKLFTPNCETEGLPLSVGSGQHVDVVVLHPSLADAWEFRARYSPYITRVCGDPEEQSLEDALLEAAEVDCTAVEILYGNGRLIEVYPL